MRRLVLVLIVLGAALAAAGAAHARVDHTKVNQQVSLVGFVVRIPCTHSKIHFTQGSLHDIFYLTFHGSHFTVVAHDQPHNLKGTDSNGNRYNGVGITREHDSGNFVNGQAETTFVNNFHMVGRGSAPTYKVHETFHVTFTPSGRLAVFHDSLRVTCG